MSVITLNDIYFLSFTFSDIVLIYIYTFFFFFNVSDEFSFVPSEIWKATDTMLINFICIVSVAFQISSGTKEDSSDYLQ